MADLNDLKRNSLEICERFANAIFADNAISPTYNSRDHKRLGLYSPYTHDEYIIRQLRENFHIGDLTPMEKSNSVKNILLTSDGHETHHIDNVNTYDVVQNCMSELTEAIKSAIRVLGPNARQATIARSLGITFPDRDGSHKDYFIANILSILRQQNIITKDVSNIFRISENKQYTWQKSQNYNTRIGSSIGEAKIAHLLEKNNIKYTHQYKFNDCKDKKSLPFDFAIELDDAFILLEVDGEQHRRHVEYFHKSIDDFEKTREHDRIKNRYANEKELFLLRIPYEKQNLLVSEEVILRYIQNPVVNNYVNNPGYILTNDDLF
jgi:hypothetical protein